MDTLNQVGLITRQYTYKIDGVEQARAHQQTDIIVDDQSLGRLFGFETARPWFGQTCFEYNNANLIDMFRGLRTPVNQFGSGRLVLYGCHCGCDYCGVISCVIERTDTTILWRDIRFENDDDDDPTETPYPHSVALYRFATRQYDQIITEYLK